MADLPSTVCVGPFTYGIQIVKRIDDEDGAFIGLCDHHNLMISVQENLAPAKTAEVLLHEVLHGVWDLSGNQDDAVDEETAVSFMGMGLLQVIRDNPALFEWIGQQVRPS